MIFSWLRAGSVIRWLPFAFSALSRRSTLQTSCGGVRHAGVRECSPASLQGTQELRYGCLQLLTIEFPARVIDPEEPFHHGRTVHVLPLLILHKLWKGDSSIVQVHEGCSLLQLRYDLPIPLTHTTINSISFLVVCGPFHRTTLGWCSV